MAACSSCGPWPSSLRGSPRSSASSRAAAPRYQEPAAPAGDTRLSHSTVRHLFGAFADCLFSKVAAFGGRAIARGGKQGVTGKTPFRGTHLYLSIQQRFGRFLIENLENDREAAILHVKKSDAKQHGFCVERQVLKIRGFFDYSSSRIHIA